MDIVSNPQPIINWITPSGQPVDSDPWVTPIRDDGVAVLEFRQVIHEYTGTWTCTILVEGTNVLGPEGTVSPRVKIGEIILSIDVIVAGEWNPRL
jgi:hypothetical protein